MATRYEKFKKMDVDELAKAIISDDAYFGDEYCKSNCDTDDECPHPEECCKKWLMEEVDENVKG